MIEVLNKKDKLEGYIDGKKYLNKKSKLLGYIENNEFKDKSGYTLLILTENRDITWNEGEKQGWVEDGKIYSSLDNSLIFEFKKDKGQILDSEGDVILYFKGDFEKLDDLDFFGIAGQYLELFA